MLRKNHLGEDVEFTRVTTSYQDKRRIKIAKSKKQKQTKIGLKARVESCMLRKYVKREIWRIRQSLERGLFRA